MEIKLLEISLKKLRVFQDLRKKKNQDVKA